LRVTPGHPALRKYVDHYWVIDDTSHTFKKNRTLYDYPGIKPEIVLLLDGELQYKYQGVSGKTNKHLLASHIHGEFLFDATLLKKFVFIQFKPRSIASLLPFVNFTAKSLMKNSFCDADKVFGESINVLGEHLKKIQQEQMAAEIDEWLMSIINPETVGLVTEIYAEMVDQKSNKDAHCGSLKMFRAITGYSYSTLERYFKKETGLTPKKYESLVRYKSAVEEIYDSQSNDWMYYVDKYGYYDQSHFIKEIKKYTGFTPNQLLMTPGLHSYRHY